MVLFPLFDLILELVQTGVARSLLNETEPFVDGGSTSDITLQISAFAQKSLGTGNAGAGGSGDADREAVSIEVVSEGGNVSSPGPLQPSRR